MLGCSAEGVSNYVDADANGASRGGGYSSIVMSKDAGDPDTTPIQTVTVVQTVTVTQTETRVDTGVGQDTLVRLDTIPVRVDTGVPPDVLVKPDTIVQTDTQIFVNSKENPCINPPLIYSVNDLKKWPDMSNGQCVDIPRYFYDEPTKDVRVQSCDDLKKSELCDGIVQITCGYCKVTCNRC
jgi:hypothetical protein